MKCPVCQLDLLIADRQGIEIDYCPKCRGIWLDRGELDKIIERSASEILPGSPDMDRSYRDLKDYPNSGKYYNKKKKNILGELFDF